MVVILLGSSFILYNLAAISNDPIGELRISRNPNAKELILVTTRELRLDLPPPLRYFMWLKNVLGTFIGHGNLGVTRTHESVASALGTAIPTTLRLVSAATFIAIILGITIGIVTALRQYSQFDYIMTFISFLLFSLPIFWVAVLLKQFLAIEFNNFLDDPKLTPTWLVGLGIVFGFMWASIIGGPRKRFWSIFIGVGIASSLIISTIVKSGWLANPGLGPIGVAVIGIGIAFGITHLSVGISDKRALKASLSMVVVGLITYYPSQWAFSNQHRVIIFPLMVLVTVLFSIGSTYIFSKVDRGPIFRTTLLTAIAIALFTILDKLMHTWKPYFESDAINRRPVPTIGQTNSLMEPGNYWLSTLDILMHLVLPTLALTAISFAGYIRYSRGTLLEVLNQDYIRTARAKGLTERTVIMRHAFRNTLIPLTTIIVVDIASIVGGAIITEHVFGWSGMGTLFNNALNNFDLNLLMGVFLVTGSLAVLANLVADLLYSALDPRIRVVSQ
jgi:peptide/nickel transport system permease protein